MGSNSCPLVDQSKRIRRTWPDPAFPVMGKELGLVGRHVYTDRTISFTTLARKAEVKRILHVVIAPAFANGISLQHLPKQMRATSGGVFLFMRDHVTWAHGLVIENIGAFAAAVPYPHASQRGMRELAFVVRELEMSFGLPWVVVSPEPQIFIQPIRVDNLAGIHLPIGVPYTLVLTEGLHNFIAEHLRQQLGP